jgi:hypothetical protein
LTATDWITSAAAVGTLIAAAAAAVSAKASRDTARILKAEHDAERARMRLRPFLELQELLKDFVAQVVEERTEGTFEANDLHRRIRTIVEYGDFGDVALTETRKFAEQEIALVEQARRALDEIGLVIRRSEIR